MIIYESTKAGFMVDALDHDIEEILRRSFMDRTRRKVAHAEVRSWANSLVQMARALRDQGIPADAGVAIEYSIPQSSMRVDFIVSGLAADGGASLVIIELKQWEHAEATAKDGIVMTRFASGLHAVSHPSYQAWSYAAFLRSFNETIYEGLVALHPCAYLHNYPDRGGDLASDFYEPYTARAPLFLKGEQERRRLGQFISERIQLGDDAQTIRDVERSRIRPSKMLADSLTGMLRGNREFVLIDDQKVVYEETLALARTSETDQKTVVIIEGGPGTGKSVVAVNLLVATTKAGLMARYVSKNAAPRSVYQHKLGGTLRRAEISNLFSGSGSYIETEADAYDVLIVDEAHRLNERSGLYGNLGDHQVRELIAAAKCTVFLIDDDQRVTLKDIGSRALLKAEATAMGATVTHLALESQFRCGGSNDYILWIDALLDITDAPADGFSIASFDFEVMDDVESLDARIVQLNREANRARVVAGYCWPWLSKRDTSKMDIEIGTYRRQWNLTSDGSLWIVADESVDQVGCIHTAQGLEVDFVGVIIGPDLVVRDGRVITRPGHRARTDTSLRGLAALRERDPQGAERQADRIIKNTYRTLLTRGQRGCYVYCTDEETSAFFRESAIDARSNGLGDLRDGE